MAGMQEWRWGRHGGRGVGSGGSPRGARAAAQLCLYAAGRGGQACLRHRDRAGAAAARVRWGAKLCCIKFTIHFKLSTSHLPSLAGYERLRPYVAFHAALRSAFQAFVHALEERCKGILLHHLETATSEYAVGLVAGRKACCDQERDEAGSRGPCACSFCRCAESSTFDEPPSVYDRSEGAAPHSADENEPAMGRPPFAETQQVGRNEPTWVQCCWLAAKAE